MSKYCNKAYAVQKDYERYKNYEIMQKHKRPVIDRNNPNSIDSIRIERDHLSATVDRALQLEHSLAPQTFAY